MFARLMFLVSGPTLVQVKVHTRVNNAATIKFRQGTCDFPSWQELPALACEKVKEQLELLLLQQKSLCRQCTDSFGSTLLRLSTVKLDRERQETTERYHRLLPRIGRTTI